MAALSANQIAGIVKHYSGTVAPISDHNAVLAIAIALAESGGNPKAVGGPNSNGTRDWGLWQINDIHNPSDRQKTVADANWLLAYRIAAMGTSWSPWATYNNGKYRDFMNAARGGWNQPTDTFEADDEQSGYDSPDEGTGRGGEGKAPVIRTLPPPFDVLNPLFMEGTWVRVGMALAGIVILVIVVGATLKNVTPMGKIASMAKAAK